MIYQAMCDLYDEGTPPDLVTVWDELARRGKLDEVGGASYVSNLANQVPTSCNGAHYARIVARARIGRGLIHVAGQIAAIAYNEPDTEVALGAAERLLAQVRARLDARQQGGGETGSGPISARELLGKALPGPRSSAHMC